MKTIIPFLKKFWFRLLFFALGLGSLLWFLIRVIPKPSRAAYPCMKAAAPLASSFVMYLIGITSFTLFFRKALGKIIQSRYLLGSLFVILGLAAGTVTIVTTTNRSLATDYQGYQVGNEPIGEGKGIFPGRVVWIHDPDATNQDCSNVEDDYWYEDKNTDQAVVNAMLSEGLQKLTGTSSDENAWDAIFRYHNNTHGRGDKGYTTGEEIVIKINMNAVYYGEDGTNTSPQICYAILNQLINKAGVAQSDIGIGDPNCTMISNAYEKCSPVFPDVNYWNSPGPDNLSATPTKVIFGSDGSSSDHLPQNYVDAEYMINIPIFKKHHRAGISLTSKNHFGSIAIIGDAWHLHESLPVPDAHEEEKPPNGNYGIYRCFVDIMGHKDLGGKTILYLIDGLWGSTNWGHPPIKWRMAPFGDGGATMENADYPNSLFLSQDPVAIQSVCFDFLYEEFDLDHPTEGDPSTSHKGPFPHFAGTDDFLHQAADPENWPPNVDYDPENDGSVLGSLGVHEHWNNATDKQYSKNLGIGNGIELISTYVVNSTDELDFAEDGFRLYPNYPNPFSESTTIHYHLAIPSTLQIRIFNSSGQLIHVVRFHDRMVGACKFVWDGRDIIGKPVPAGTYICNIRVSNTRGKFDMNNKMQVMR